MGSGATLGVAEVVPRSLTPMCEVVASQRGFKKRETGKKGFMSAPHGKGKPGAPPEHALSEFFIFIFLTSYSLHNIFFCIQSNVL